MGRTLPRAVRRTFWGNKDHLNSGIVRPREVIVSRRLWPTPERNAVVACTSVCPDALTWPPVHELTFEVLDDRGDVVSVAIPTESQVCVLRRGGEVDCTANDGKDECESALPSHPPAPMPGLPRIVEMATAPLSHHVCARSADGRVFCWGSNKGGALGATPCCTVGHGTTVPL